jgi:hypothetical protein
MHQDDTGKARGGHARAAALTPAERREIAQRAAKVRHALPKATHGSPDHPLKIGDIEIPAYVLEDGTRVLSQRGLQTGIGMSTGGGSRAGEQRIAVFIDGLTQKGVPTNDLASRLRNPIRFTTNNRLAFGYEATIITDICDAVLAARQTPGALQPQQAHIAHQCEILVRGFARVGIIALVDEATGYQADRARDALARILEAFIAKELQPWVRTFPVDYYRELFRLRGLPFPSDTVKRPQYFGTLTNDIVYKRLAPGVLKELRSVTPRDDETGRYKHKFFQRLTANTGYPKLREHLGSVVTIMKLSSDYRDFKEKLDRLHTKFGDTMPLPFEYNDDDDDGKGI